MRDYSQIITLRKARIPCKFRESGKLVKRMVPCDIAIINYVPRKPELKVVGGKL